MQQKFTIAVITIKTTIIFSIATIYLFSFFWEKGRVVMDMVIVKKKRNVIIIIIIIVVVNGCFEPFCKWCCCYDGGCGDGEVEIRLLYHKKKCPSSLFEKNGILEKTDFCKKEGDVVMMMMAVKCPNAVFSMGGFPSTIGGKKKWGRRRCLLLSLLLLLTSLRQ